MRQRSQARRVAEWTGVGLCAVVLVGWAFSIVWTVKWVEHGVTLTRAITLYTGGIAVNQYPAMRGPIPIELHRDMTPGWSVYRESDLVLGLELPRISWDDPPPYRFVFVPLWLPFLVLGVPTAILWFPTVIRWYRDRKPPCGHCQHCGYDLTGNVTGICPECGNAI